MRFSALFAASLISGALATIDDAFAATILDVTNQKRDLHGVPRFTWDSELAAFADEYATRTYKCDGQLVHSGGPNGENIAAGYATVNSSVNAWYNQVKLYNFTHWEGISGKGHFTAMIWARSNRMGCAYIKCGGAWGTYIICEYNPRSNVVGQFEKNVYPPKSDPIYPSFISALGKDAVIATSTTASTTSSSSTTSISIEHVTMTYIKRAEEPAPTTAAVSMSSLVAGVAPPPAPSPSANGSSVPVASQTESSGSTANTVMVGLVAVALAMAL